MLNSGPVSLCSKRQPPVALSSTEARYITLTLSAKESTWLRLLLTKLGLLEANDQHAEINVNQENTGVQALQKDLAGFQKERNLIIEPLCNSVNMRGDNQGSIALAHNPVLHAQTKHINIQHQYIRDKVCAGRINLTYIPTSEMIADGLTKPLTHVKFHKFVRQRKIA